MLQGLLDIIVFFARNMLAAFALFFVVWLLQGPQAVLSAVRWRPSHAWVLSLALLLYAALARRRRDTMAVAFGLTMAMACGGEDISFRSTWPRPLPAFSENPVLIDPISVVDSSLSGRDLSPSTCRAVGAAGEDGVLAR